MSARPRWRRADSLRPSGWVLALVLVVAACAGVQQRFPDDVAAALARDPMRRLDTARFIIYYPAGRRAEVERFLARADRCAELLRDQAVEHAGEWADKLVIVMPDVAFNNAFVLPELAGYEEVSVIPLGATLDFATEFGIPPDPGYIACHELVHYVHEQQVAGFWRAIDAVFGHLYTPQVGYDPWFFEGLATHYEAELSPGVGRPTWPIFTGMFAAAYAGHHLGSGELSAFAREASVGHHYLVGTMFVRFLTERYGTRAMWAAIASQAHALTGWLFAGTFKAGFGVSFGDLLDEFDAWSAKQFPVREPPPGQRRLATLGNDARYARGRDGTEAWVADDVDLPARLTVRDPRGQILVETSLVDVVPPRTLVQADPLLVSGLSITADGGEVWLTVIDLGATYQTPRLVRWRRGERGVTEVASGLGPGATIDPRGDVYYYCAVDGDRWSLAAWDVRTGARRVVLDAPPGTYVLGAQVSADGARLVASVFDGAFAAWVIESGAVMRRIGDAGPVYDPSFTSDGRVLYLAEIAGRFQAVIDGVPATDAPYAVLAAREAAGTLRFLDREGWDWQLAEVAVPPPGPPPPPSSEPPARVVTPIAIESDAPYCRWDHLWFPQERAPTLLVATGVPHLGAVLGGGDRLGLHRWSLAGYVQPALGPVATRAHYGASAAWLDESFAPFQLLAQAGFLDWVAPVQAMPNVTVAEERRTRDASLTLARTWRGEFTGALAGVYTADHDDAVFRRLAGPQLAIAWQSIESTRYTGARRALLGSLTAAYYPHELSTFSNDLEDLGGSIGTVLPLPFGRRHTLAATLRGRALVSRSDTGLLQVGGDSGLAALWSQSPASAPSFDATRFPPNLRFVEPLRGYEDYAIATDRAALVDVGWRYPVIVDRGVAATFGVLPASFVRQLDLELFGAGAADRARAIHAAAGAAITLRIQLLRIPLIVTYQLARRLVDDRAITQLVGVGPGP